MIQLVISTAITPDPLVQRLTGIMPSDAVLVIDSKDKVGQLWLDARYTSWEVTPRSWWTITKHKRLPDWSFLDPERTYTISSSYSIATQQTLDAAFITTSVADVDLWTQHRLIKSNAEIQLMKDCYAKSLEVLWHIQTQISNGSIIWRSCLSLRGECIAYAMSLGLSGESFDMIVATGVQTASPHHMTDTTPIWEWALLIDMGWKWRWYCSDMTRCWRIGEGSWEEYTHRKEIYTVVESAKKQCEVDWVFWMTGTQIDALAREYIIQAWYGEYFTHSTWHGIGLEVHELPWITKSLLGENLVVEWMCLTIEPWIYIPWKFGVRLEDSYEMQITWLKRL